MNRGWGVPLSRGRDKRTTSREKLWFFVKTRPGKALKALRLNEISPLGEIRLGSLRQVVLCCYCSVRSRSYIRSNSSRSVDDTPDSSLER